MSAPRVLIIDDEKGLRTGTERLLQEEGYQVSTAEDGRSGIKAALENDFDIVIIDYKMPDLNGIEVLKEISKSKPNSICIIATAYASYETAIESTKTGAYSYIPKPFTPEDLLRLLEKAYEKRQMLLEAEKLRLEREERLLEIAFEKSRLNTIINSITEGVIVVNRSLELVLFNPASKLFFDLNKDLISHNISLMFPNEVNGIIEKTLLNGNGKKKVFITQIELGNIFAEVTCSPVPHPDGSIAGVVIVIKDITEQKKVEMIKSQFVSMVAHELKTPLAAVIGYINIILDKKLRDTIDEEKKIDFMQKSHNRLIGLLDMVNDLLDISKMEMKTKMREFVSLDIAAIIKSIIDLLEVDIHNREIKIEIKQENEIPMFSGDANEITRMFTNLISNALKYNKPQGSISINISFANDYIVTAIEDTGIGIKEEDMNKLFQEFHRIKNTHTKRISGTGLGLSIVKRIADSYSGKIEVKSKYEHGTKFTVSLPVKRIGQSD